MKNRKAWIRIFEAVIAVLLIASVLLIVIGQGSITKEEDALQIYQTEISILREVQLDNLLRESVLKVESLPVKWEDFDSNGLGDVKDKIILKTPDYLDCEAQICEMLDDCLLGEEKNEEVFVQSVVITANLNTYNPRQIKLFCDTEKEPCIAESLEITCGTKTCDYSTNNCGQEVNCGSCEENGVCSNGVCSSDINYSDCDNDLTNGYECYLGGGNLCYQEGCCTPIDVCSVIGYTCGTYDDGCGGTVECGSCTDDCSSCIEGSCQKSCSYCGPGECNYLNGCYDNPLGSCLLCDNNEYWYDKVDKNCDGVVGRIDWLEAHNSNSYLSNNIVQNVKTTYDSTATLYNRLRGKTLTWYVTVQADSGPVTTPKILQGSYTFPDATAPSGYSSLDFRVSSSYLIRVSNNYIKIWYATASSTYGLSSCSYCSSWTDTWLNGKYYHFLGYSAPYTEFELKLYPDYFKQSVKTNNWRFGYIHLSSSGWNGWYSISDTSSSSTKGKIYSGSYITLN